MNTFNCYIMSELICEIKASSRLHFGFLDLHGGMGRRFGSIGTALAEPVLHLRMNNSETFQVTGENQREVQRLAEFFFKQLGIEPAVTIHVHQAIPAHQGLGSGTQTALAVGHAIAYLYKTGWDSKTIALMTGRGKRSGIGIGAFDHGGFLVDGGKDNNDKGTPPVISRLAMPSAWRVILINDADSYAGLHGDHEKQAFKNLPLFSEHSAGHLSRHVVMRILPAIAENSFAAFAEAIGHLQDKIGDYFSGIQKGRYANDHIKMVMGYLREQGVTGIGQSSWGPTGFAFAPEQTVAEDLAERIQQVFSSRFAVKLCVTQINNSGAMFSYQ